MFVLPSDFYDSDLQPSINKEEVEESDEEKIGAYTLSVRSKKILKYKEKVAKRRLKCPIVKRFSGRSQIAS